jgi:Family of unknown function (DUF6941)
VYDKSYGRGILMPQQAVEVDEIEVKVMMAADGAQAVGGKLYVLGGGFDRLNMPTVPFHHRFDLAMLIDVPWNATNQPYEVVVELVNADMEFAGYRAEARMETGRPPGIRQGTSITIPIAIPVVAEFREPGRYVLRASVNGRPKNQLAIEAVAPPSATQSAAA